MSEAIEELLDRALLARTIELEASLTAEKLKVNKLEITVGDVIHEFEQEGRPNPSHLLTRIEGQASEITSLHKALKKYGRHTSDCEKRFTNDRPFAIPGDGSLTCNCGLEQALEVKHE